MALATEQEMRTYYSRWSIADLQMLAFSRGWTTISSLRRKPELVTAVAAQMMKEL